MILVTIDHMHQYHSIPFLKIDVHFRNFEDGAWGTIGARPADLCPWTLVRRTSAGVHPTGSTAVSWRVLHAARTSREGPRVQSERSLGHPQSLP